MFQILSLGCGFAGSYWFGRLSARDAAQEIIKPHARSAFRRLLSLYDSLSRLAVAIAVSKGPNDGEVLHPFVLDKLEAMVREQLATADDALEDWRDIVPDEVREIRSRIASAESKRLTDNE